MEMAVALSSMAPIWILPQPSKMKRNAKLKQPSDCRCGPEQVDDGCNAEFNNPQALGVTATEAAAFRRPVSILFCRQDNGRPRRFLAVCVRHDT